ncbi:LOW QUALITY PROTEIN: ciliary microtubule inner protein 1 [Buteo buteo]|uniref:LOW QUALITY PROTEIN: ciliary microtubule inner protein 1 n=1 Tax=Buteo buteo TaxID=30397 RepID=UPI003EBA959B
MAHVALTSVKQRYSHQRGWYHMKTAHGKKHAKDKSFRIEVFENRYTCVVQSRHKHCDSAARSARARPGRATWRGGTDPAQPCNFVARDNCWKKYIESELEATRRWSHKWGFLKTPLELIEDEKKENTKPKIQLPEHLQVRPVTPVEKYIKVIPSPPVPKTTQGFIGWRSAVPGLELERGFQIQSCKGTFFKDLKWPCEPSD